MKLFITATLSILQLVTAQVKMRDDRLNGTLINEESLLLIYEETIDEILNHTLTSHPESPMTAEMDLIGPETIKLVTTSALPPVITTEPAMTTTKKLQVTEVTEEPTEMTLTNLIETKSPKTLDTTSPQTLVTAPELSLKTTKLSVTEDPTEMTLTDLIVTKGSKTLDITSPQTLITAPELSLTTTKVSVTEDTTEMTLTELIVTKGSKTLDTTSPQTLVTAPELSLTTTKVSVTEDTTEMTLTELIVTKGSKTLDTTYQQTIVKAPELPLTTTKVSVTEDPIEMTRTDLIETKSPKTLDTTSPQTLVTAPELSLTTTNVSMTDEPTEITITYLLDLSTKTPKTLATTSPKLISTEPSITTTRNFSMIDEPTEITMTHILDLATQTSKTLAITSPEPTVTSTEPSITTTKNFSMTEESTEITFTDQIVTNVSKSSVTTSPQPPKKLLPNDTLTDRLQSTDSPVTTEKQMVTTETEEVTTTEYNPCLQEDPKMPNFSVPGRRISEIKCKEYLWQIEQRKNVTQRDIDCTLYQINKYGFTEMYAVAGGRDAYHGEFPHMAAIGWKGTVNPWEFKCGSTLISHNFVLTAAHCTKVSSRDTTVSDPSPKIVRLGVANIKTAAYFPPRDYGISKIILHPQYKAPKQYYDIALMELDFNIQFDYIVHPACLWTRFDTSDLGVKASVTGWGVLQSAPIPIAPPPILQVGVVDFIDSQLCDELLRPSCNRKQCGIEDHQICAGILAGGVDACQGDSGGPLQVKIPLQDETIEKMYYVVGVTSFGIGCALENSPGVYSRVSSFIDWIEEIVWTQSV